MYLLIFIKIRKKIEQSLCGFPNGVNRLEMFHTIPTNSVMASPLVVILWTYATVSWYIYSTMATLVGLATPVFYRYEMSLCLATLVFYRYEMS